MLDAAGRIRDISSIATDISPATLVAGLLDRLRATDPATLPEVDGPQRLGAPLLRPGKMVCVGLNYRAHAEESGMEVPQEPVLFMKACSAVTGPFDPVLLPRNSTKLDWEVELAAVIGRTARHVAVTAALDHVMGYCLANDVSERAFQLEHAGQWCKGKSHDTFAPLGPWILTADAMPAVQALDIWLDVNAERMQSSNTRMMIFSVATIVSYISTFMTLEPGDVVLTGTPPGVGLGRDPPRYLVAGDRLHFGITGLGEQEHVIIAAG